MPASYWLHALVYAAELENLFTPTTAGSNNSCYYAYHCTHPDNSKAITFGCMAWLWIQLDRWTDQLWDDVAIPCVALGFAFHMGKKGWLLGTIDGSR
eukprot:2044311-Rhodomonas_salina.1